MVIFDEHSVVGRRSLLCTQGMGQACQVLRKNTNDALARAVNVGYEKNAIDVTSGNTRNKKSFLRRAP
jgi:hypothetical protein